VFGEGKAMAQIIPIRDLRKCAEISEMCKKTKEPIFVTRNGYGDMVIMSMETYEEKLVRNEIYESVMLAEEEVNNGAKPIPAREVFASLGKKYGK
jgi:PHD/YefM family antitoxin component YafN of YafNO toxin-antitoxin module